MLSVSNVRLLPPQFYMPFGKTQHVRVTQQNTPDESEVCINGLMLKVLTSKCALLTNIWQMSKYFVTILHLSKLQ